MTETRSRPAARTSSGWPAYFGLFLVCAFAALAGPAVAGVAEISVPASPAGTSAPPSPLGQLAGMLAAVALEAGAVFFSLRKRTERGPAFAALLFVAHFGAKTFMSQIESAIFLPHILPDGLLPKLFLSGAVESAIVAVLGSLVLGAFGKAPAAVRADGDRSVADLPFRILALRFAACAVLYYALYFSFGFVAYLSPDLQAYYAPLGLEKHMAWMPFFQIMRGILWTGLAVLASDLSGLPRRLRAVASGLWLALLMNSVLLVPGNPIMPDAVRLVHFVETASSNFLFGFLASLALSAPRLLPARKAPARG